MLLDLMDAIFTATDSNHITATMALDLTAAFDCVQHSILVEKLRLYGLDNDSIKWIESYLAHRSSFIVIGSAKSVIKSTVQGVPQGSCLGPLLYLTYVNEMLHVINDDRCEDRVHQDTSQLFSNNCNNCGIMPMYADDGLYLTSSNNRNQNQDRIDDSFIRIKDFLNANGLQVNESKTYLTEYMTWQKRTRTNGIPPDLTVQETIEDRTGAVITQDKLISDKPHCKMLGFNLKNNLTWDGHLTSGSKSILPKLRRQIGQLSRICQNMNTRARLQLLNAFVLSRMSYMICLWGNATLKHIRKAQIVLNSAARLATGYVRTTRQETLMTRCGWLMIEDMTTYHAITQMLKLIRWDSPGHLRRKIHLETDYKVSTQLPRLQQTARTFRHQTIDRWNSLPEYLRTENSIGRFKKGVKTWLLEQKEQLERHRENDRSGQT